MAKVVITEYFTAYLDAWFVRLAQAGDDRADIRQGASSLSRFLSDAANLGYER